MTTQQWRGFASLASLALLTGLAACGGATSAPVTISLSPQSATVLAGATQQFTATVGGAANTAVSWSLQEGASAGTVGPTGLYTAPVAAGTVHLVATSAADASKSATATITVTSAAPVVVTLTPPSANVLPSGTQQFTAQVSGSANTAVTWTVQESGGGQVTAAGLYTAPAAAGTFHVVATSAADTSKSGRATVTVAAPVPVAVSISPPAATLLAGATRPFIATVTGATGTAVSWSIQEGAAGGAVTSDGVYTAPIAGGAYHLVATSRADPGAHAAAAITVTPVSVSVAPPAATISTGETQQLVATVIAGSDIIVNWSVQESGGGEVSTNGLYYAPSVAGTYHVIATSLADGSKTAAATITVVPAVAVTINPDGALLRTGAAQQFTASVAGTANTGVTWSVLQSGGGSVGADGLYAAPAVAGQYDVIATSVADSRKTATVQVRVVDPIVVTMDPTTATVLTGSTQHFTATAPGSPFLSTWSVQESNGGTVGPGGGYFPPAVSGTYHVLASNALGLQPAVATVTVVQAPPREVGLALVNGVPTVSWFAPAGASSAVRYQVLRSTDGVAFANLGAPAAISPLTDVTAEAGGTYYYQVQSIQSGDASVAVASAPSSVTLAPGPVTNLTATAGCTSVHLSWTAPKGATSYSIVRTPDGAGTTTSWNETIPQSDDTNAAFDTSYSYSVIANNGGGQSASVSASAKRPLAGPIWSGIFAGDIQTSLIWLAPPWADAGTTYTIARAASASGPFVSVKQGYGARSWTDTGVAPSTDYWYQVQAASTRTSCPTDARHGATGVAGSAITGGNARFVSVLDTGPEQSVVEDLSVYGFFANRYLPGAGGAPGTLKYYAGLGTADGYFTIPDVPAGFSYVPAAGWIYTDARRFDETLLTRGRAGLVPAALPTPVTVTLKGLAPWGASDRIQLFSFNATVNHSINDGSSGVPVVGATSTTLGTDLRSFSPGLLDATKGDAVTIYQIALVAGATPFSYSAAQRTCTGALGTPTMVDGQAASIGCIDGADMTPVPPITGNLNLARSQFASAIGPAATGWASFEIAAYKGLSNYGVASGFGALPALLKPTLLWMNLDSNTTDVFETLTYGNPFSSAYQLAYEYSAGASVTYTAPATAACPSPVPGSFFFIGYRQADVLSDGQLPSSIAPAIEPVSGVTVTPLGAGGPVQVRWTEPTTGANLPTTYEVSIHQLTVDAQCKTVDSFVSYVATVHGQSTVLVPSFDFPTQDGSGTYLAIVRTAWLPGELPGLQQPGLVGTSARQAIISTYTPAFQH